MPIRFRCPECQESVQVNEALAGLHTRCPSCSAKVPVPEEGAAGGPTAVTANPLAAGGGDFEPPRRSDYGEGGRREYEPVARQGTDPAWGLVRVALGLEMSAVIIGICIFLAQLLMQCVVMYLVSNPGAGPGIGFLRVLQIVQIGIVVALVAGMILLAVGRGMACAVPATAGTKGLAIGALICTLAWDGVFATVVIVGSTGFFGMGLGMERAGPGVSQAVALLLVGLLLVTFLAMHVLYMLFLRGAAVYFGNRSLASKHVVFLVVSTVLFLLVIVAVVFITVLAVGMAMGGGRGGEALVWFMIFVPNIVALILLSWYCSLLSETRSSIGVSRQTW